MYLFSIVIIIAGLVLFETITSIDNAIINAEVLSTMSERAKRWFLTWGLLICGLCDSGTASLADGMAVYSITGPGRSIYGNILK
jgi:predicted tellurium resistance membrane protein TerC